MAAALAPTAVAPVSDVSALIQDMLTSVAGAVVPVTQLQSDLYSFLMSSAVSALIQDMLTSVAGAVVPLTQLQSDLYSFLMSSAVSALIQDMLTSVAGAVVPLTQLQSALYFFLVGIAGMDPVVAAVTLTWIQSNLGGVAGAGLSPAADASVASLSRLVLLFAGIPGGPLAGNATVVAPLGGIAASIFAVTSQVGEASSLPGLAQSFFRPASSELLLTGSLAGLAAVALPGTAGTAGLMVLNAAGVLPLSLAALAALALPGVGGLTILTAAGVRVGYRQAKAGFALRTAGIARFARAGAVPLGVVRSGSLVVVRPRALRVVRSGAVPLGVVVRGHWLSSEVFARHPSGCGKRRVSSG